MFLIFLVNFCLIQTSFSIHYGHEVGGTSMDSTHYDRRLFQQQCPINNKNNNQHQVIYWSNIKSTTTTTSNTTNENTLIPIRKKFFINRGDDQYLFKPSSGTINVNNTDPLDIDEAFVTITVDKQVSNQKI